jgi:hypothetical protein
MLERLQPVRGARHSAIEDTEYCMQGTRVKVLQDLAQWATTDTASPVFWLSGPAGTGKTAIAKTFCLWLTNGNVPPKNCNMWPKNCNMLGAGFFAAQEESRQDASSIIRTIAYDLAMSRPKLRCLIADAIQCHPDVHSLSTMEQLQTLVLEPLQAAVSDDNFPRLVLVIDGLNDCRRDEEHGHPAGSLVPALVSFLQPLAGSIKLFVSSSNESGVQTLFNKHCVKPYRLIDCEVLPDIHEYYRQAFMTIARERDRTNWPSAQDINALVTITGHFFIFASTVKRYLSNERYDPADRLCKLLNSRDGHFGPLDELYRVILHNSILDSSGREDDRFLQRVQMLLSTIAFAMTPLPLADIASILNLNCEEVKHDLIELSSVVIVPHDNNQPVRFFHSSFVDFLCNQERCSDVRFVQNASIAHTALARHCLEALSDLVPDAYQIRHPGTLNFETRLPESYMLAQLPGHLRYACRYWAEHAAQPNVSGLSLNLPIRTFFSCHVASWIEACSLLSCIDRALLGLRALLAKDRKVRVHLCFGFESYHSYPQRRILLNCVPTLRQPPISYRNMHFPYRFQLFRCTSLAHCSDPWTCFQYSQPSYIPSRTSSPQTSPWKALRRPSRLKNGCVA